MGSINQNSFDAWGRSRNPYNWNYDMRYKREMPLPELTTRGYTGHEHLNQFQLINMNGRLYDPITKQMSQPDILNVDPYSTQSYNRYSYCMNNPLKYTDPSGYISRKIQMMNTYYQRMSSTAGGYSIENEFFFMYANCVNNPFFDGSLSLLNSDYYLSLLNDIFKGGEGEGQVDTRTDDEKILDFAVAIFAVKGEVTEIKYTETFKAFMEYQAANNSVEVAAYQVVKDGVARYFVQPWLGNTATKSKNNTKHVPSIYRNFINAQYHTHVNGSGPSFTDASYSYGNRIPVYAVNGNLEWYRVAYLSSGTGVDIAPSRGQEYWYPYYYGSRVF